jgi:hypothetical protein
MRRRLEQPCDSPPDSVVQLETVASDAEQAGLRIKLDLREQASSEVLNNPLGMPGDGNGAIAAGASR